MQEKQYIWKNKEWVGCSVLEYYTYTGKRKLYNFNFSISYGIYFNDERYIHGINIEIEKQQYYWYGINLL